MESRVIITVDGPAVSGKGTAARALAAHYGYYYIETGLLYRALGYCVREATGADRSKIAHELVPTKLAALVTTFIYQFKHGRSHVIVGGKDITDQLRTPDIDWYASHVSSFPEVRAVLKSLQRQLGSEHGAVIDGRDCGTVIFPNAQHKFFLTAPLSVRADRLLHDPARHADSYTHEELMRDIMLRDIRDTVRSSSPLVPAVDAIIIDNGNLTAEETRELLCGIIDRRRQ